MNGQGFIILAERQPQIQICHITAWARLVHVWQTRFQFLHAFGLKQVPDVSQAADLAFKRLSGLDIDGSRRPGHDGAHDPDMAVQIELYAGGICKGSR